MKIALACVPVMTGNISFNLSVILNIINDCKKRADIVVFGESVLQGFDCLSWDYEMDSDVAVSRSDERIRKIQTAAKESGIAVCLGYIEKVENLLFSSALFIGANGEIVHNFHRVSTGWKERCADYHYAEGNHFEVFSYNGKRFAIALCGDLWMDGRPEEMKALIADVVLWPVWCDYNAQEWNTSIKYEYAEQAAKCGANILFVNPYCVDKSENDSAAGGAVHFRNGEIFSEIPAGSTEILFVEV